jgi:hypothetical protein
LPVNRLKTAIILIFIAVKFDRHIFAAQTNPKWPQRKTPKQA